MERQKFIKEKTIIVIIYIYFITGIVWHLLPITKGIVVVLTPYGLFFFPLLIFFLERKTLNLRTLIWLALVFVLTIIFEIIGVKTGLIFGDYLYKDTLGIKIWSVPLLIGLNWMMIIYGLFSFTEKYFNVNKLALSFLTSSFAVLFDFILEPVAVKLNYWEWNSISVPVSNYISWFVISFLFVLAGSYINIKKGNPRVVHYLFAQLLFFASLNFLITS